MPQQAFENWMKNHGFNQGNANLCIQALSGYHQRKMGPAFVLPDTSFVAFFTYFNGQEMINGAMFHEN